ncbi:MAG TPA: RNA polymerase sigma factor [Thermoanaerobaculia bacterium]|nr:RNA polymerase sigma factor [Thermoanaerobaculia bacterium]
MTLTPQPAERVRILVERIQSGIDYERSCAEVYRLYRRRVQGFFGLRGFSTDEAAELTQETFIRVFNAIEDLRTASRFPRWLFEIAANIYRNELRRRGAAKRDAFEESIEELASNQAEGRVDALAALSSKAPGPLDGTLRRERLAGLRSQLDQLPPQMRRCVYLRLYQDLKYREIAALMRISIETVKAHLHQAQKRLKVAFSDRPDSQESQGAL